MWFRARLIAPARGFHSSGGGFLSSRRLVSAGQGDAGGTASRARVASTRSPQSGGRPLSWKVKLCCLTQVDVNSLNRLVFHVIWCVFAYSGEWPIAIVVNLTVAKDILLELAQRRPDVQA